MLLNQKSKINLKPKLKRFHLRVESDAPLNKTKKLQVGDTLLCYFQKLRSKESYVISYMVYMVYIY